MTGPAFDLERDALATALQFAVRAMVSGEHRLAGKMVLTADRSGTLEIHANDWRTDVRAVCPATVSVPGSIMLDGERLKAFVAKVRKGAIMSAAVTTATLPTRDKDARERTHSVLRILAGRGRTDLVTEDPAAYPARDPAPEEDGAAGRGADIAAALRLAQPAVLRNLKDAREMLMGIHAAPQGGRLRISGLDGHRLHQTFADASAPDSLPEGIIPMDAMELIALIAEHAGEETARLSLSDQSITIRVQGITCSAPLIRQQYPPTERLFPAQRTVVTLNAAAFASTVDRVATVVEKPTHGIRLRVEPETHRLIVTSRAELSSLGTAEEWIEADADGPAEMCINHRYLLSALDFFGDDPVSLRFGQPGDPVTITDPVPGDRRFLIMHVR